MQLPYFGSYLAGLLLVSVLFGVLAKNLSDGMNAKGKKPYVYGGVSSIALSVLGWLSGLISKDLFVSFWILSGVFLLFGIIHQVFTKNNYFYSVHHNQNRVFAGQLMFGLSLMSFTILIMSALIYFLNGDQSYLFYPMAMSTLFFFVPMLFQKTLDAALSIPPKIYTPWYYPIDQNLAIPDEDPRERILVIGFEMTKNQHQSTPTYFRAKAPENIKLGDLFYFFIQDYNELNAETPITITDENNRPFQFLFKKKAKWYQSSKFFNPERNFRENGILENTIIIAERV
jgi:hypothetical protein